MHVFVTGASGFIGTVTIKELIAHGHTVTGLARSSKSQEAVKAIGAQVISGDLHDLDALKKGAASSDGVIHLAFIHDDFSPSGYTTACEVDRKAINALADGLAGTGKPLIISSGSLLVPKGQLSDEDTLPQKDDPPFSERAKSDELINHLSEKKDIRGMTVRFSPTVHGKGDKGFMTFFIQMAQKNGFSAYIDDGAARWPAVHRNDAAVLLRLALEHGKPASVYNAVAEQGVTMKEIMTVIGKKLNMPVKSIAHDDVEGIGQLGFIGHVINLDNPTQSEKTKKALGWMPKELGVLQDLEENYDGDSASSSGV